MTFYFYDLETSGINPRDSRIVQFGGQRTDEQFNPIGEPDNILLKLTDDILPEPDAVLITGITPQQTRQNGITEVEFLRYFTDKIATADTVMLGFNSIRFDDEFVRFLHYRNFYDPYEWQWKDGRGKWDMLDVARMTRALRPDGIKWPFASDGKPANRLELLTSINGLDHASAHDALSDVSATMVLARLLREKQPKLFDYLLSMRDKRKVQDLVCGDQPFVYTTGSYPSEYEKTSVATYLSEAPGQQGALVWDLRHDPTEWLGKSAADLSGHIFVPYDSKIKKLPMKVLKFNSCPAVAPMGTLDEASQKRLKIDMPTIEANRSALKANKQFAALLKEAYELKSKKEQSGLLINEQDVDGLLYDGFFADKDKATMSAVRASDGKELDTLSPDFSDQRLSALFPLYKARNFPSDLTDEQRAAWESFRSHRLMDGGEKSRAAKYFKRLAQIAERPGLKDEDRFLLEELQLFGQSILPVVDDV